MQYVLYRKNLVIKNIIFISNLIFTLIFAFLSIGEKSNIVLTIILFPATFLVNHGLKKTINTNPNDKTTQTIASYVACFYMFLLSIVIYFKLKYGTVEYLKECGYILIYYSLIICSFYQDKKIMKFVNQWVLVLVTILHFTVTYGIVFSEMASDMEMFMTTFFVSEEFRDIILRTILLCVFMLVVYIIVSMSEYMQAQRKTELIKRREVQEDFTNVVTKIFEVTLDSGSKNENDIENIIIVSKIAKRLAELLNLPTEQCLEIEQISKIHIERKINFMPNATNEDEKFTVLREQTNLGSIIISRIQLERKCEDMMRSTFEKSVTDEFVNKMKKIQNETTSQIILISDLYVSMRSEKSYKRPTPHKTSMQYITENFRVYFDGNVFERFERFADEFEKIYNGEDGGENYEL